jgi:shikimate dehydrogenase
MIAKRSGITEAYDGLGMLVNQAALSFEIWHNFKPDVDGIELQLRT